MLRGGPVDAYTYIKNAIVEGTLSPGERLTEEVLAARLELSRTPIREALKTLAAEGLVTPLKRGMAVRTFEERDVLHIYDLRALLEGYAGHQAALNRSEHDLAELSEHTLRFEEAIRRTVLSTSEKQGAQRKALLDVVQFNSHFHAGIIRATGNEYIQFMLSKVVLLPLVFRSFHWYSQAQLERSVVSHRAILKALEHRDGDRAKAAMAEHIYQGRDHVLAHIEESED